MSSLRAEYQRFLGHLANQQVHDDVRRMANLVMSQLSQLAEVGANRRARSVRLAPLAVQHLLGIDPQSQDAAQDAPSGRQQLRLQRLEVGPFRGFMEAEVFDLSHDITLVYGPNGTGKSSFFEALETAMLGSISEAEAKRFDHRAYCNNARLGRHVAPRLFASVNDEETGPLRTSDEEYRFCFVEKNRLDDFDRIAARTPGDQRQLIATLFGVDQFSEFVRGFNPNLDENLNIAGFKALQLDARRNQVAASQQTIDNHEQRLAAVTQEEEGLAARIHAGNTYQACSDWILGTTGTQGRLAYLRSALESPIPVIHGCTAGGLDEKLSQVDRHVEASQSAQQSLAARAADVSYSNLYDALLQLSQGATECPACGTTLDRVNQNPFERAREGLAELAELKTLQQRAENAASELDEAFRSLLAEMQRVCAAAAQVCNAELQASLLPELPQIGSGQWLQVWIDNERRAWCALLRLANLVEQADGNTRQIVEQREALSQERERLDSFRIEIERCRLLRSQALTDVEQARATIAQFEEDNQQLIAEVGREAQVVEHHRRIKAAYDAYLPQLQAYLAALPGQLLQGLGESARDLYNSFNREDPPAAQIHALWLPLAENGKIEIEFVCQPGQRFDALMILSEGHIRCLGLAILLAKNLAESCPVVIFDDVVNAIDDEHRDGIWRTFFERGLLDDKQVILTSHAEEFLHRIQQELGAQRSAQIRRYRFLPHQGEHHLRIDTDPPTKNYVSLAQASVQAEEKRDALRHSRAAIESLTDRAWTWLGKRYDGKLELKLSGPRANWELNNKCIKLRAALGRIPDHAPGLQSILSGLDALLQRSGTSIEWHYLNGGTHDSQRDHEFDRAAVRAIVDAASAMDNGLEALRNG
ncbi:ATPase [Pseudomonas putida]|uniref:ATPase n=1 Tax=Pseudomonas putida TaxID=303 RepID=A0A2Z4RGF5_PSEPU|nr:AAA family ATPase [Pseudomonas putida]AWY39034.1 ATPase [Pseudomonas putida]